MSVDHLDRELREYCREMDARQESLTFNDILERAGDLQVIPGRGRRQAPPRPRWVIAPIAVLAIVAVAIGIRALTSEDGAEPAATPTTTPVLATTTTSRPDSATTTTTSVPDTTVDAIRDLGLPGPTSHEPAGDYGWTTSPGRLRGWLHRVIEDPPGVTRQTQLAFVVSDDCFTGVPAAEPRALTVAGLDGFYLEPYDGEHNYWSRSHPGGGETTGAYALPIADRTLCVYLRWDKATTPDELNSAREVVESIRGEPYGNAGVRINFTLPAGWDTG